MPWNKRTYRVNDNQKMKSFQAYIHIHTRPCSCKPSRHVVIHIGSGCSDCDLTRLVPEKYSKWHHSLISWELILILHENWVVHSNFQELPGLWGPAQVRFPCSFCAKNAINLIKEIHFSWLQSCCMINNSI